MTTPELNATLQRLDDQIAWYDAKSGANQLRHKLSTYLEFFFAACAAITAWTAPPVLTACLAGLIVLARGIASVNQWEQNWVSYRATAESLKHEKYLFLARAGPYASDATENPQRALAERVEGTISREHAAWVSLAEQHRGSA